MARNKLIWRVIAEGRGDGSPFPFPGKCPTRIYWKVLLRLAGGRLQPEEYCGKPCRIGTLRLLKLLRDPTATHVQFFEVDRQNVLFGFNADVRRLPERHLGDALVRCQIYAAARLYHPYHSVVYGWEWMLRPWWIKRIKTSKGIMTVYSPTEKLERTVHLIPFKTYVDGLPGGIYG